MQISGRAQAMTNFLSEKQRIRRWIERQGVQIHDATPKESEAVRQILKDTPPLVPRFAVSERSAAAFSVRARRDAGK